MRFPISVGILGGGQLARMLVLAAYELGVEPKLLLKSSEDCATRVTKNWVTDDGTDGCVARFAEEVDVILIENEFIDLSRLSRLSRRGRLVPLIPSLKCLGKIQSKLDQKKNLSLFKIPTAKFLKVNSQKDFDLAAQVFESRMVMKKSRLGYDGNGTFIFDGIKAIESKKQELAHLFESGFDGYCEEFIDFKSEIAVMIARTKEGHTKSFPVAETFQIQGKCDWASVSKNRIPSKIEQKAQRIAQKVIQKFDGVGVFGIEMFWLSSGEVVVNEIAPRVHNSGHLTMNGFTVSQFEQHLRAALGLPLVEPKRLWKTSVMVNIIGEKILQLTYDNQNIDIGAKNLLSEKIFSWIHWYGKQGEACGRKLGHINLVSNLSHKETLKFGKKLRRSISI